MLFLLSHCAFFPILNLGEYTHLPFKILDPSTANISSSKILLVQRWVLNLPLVLIYLPATLNTSDYFYPWFLDITLSHSLSVLVMAPLLATWWFLSVSSVWISLTKFRFQLLWTALRYLTGASNSMCPKSNSANLLCLHCVQLFSQLCTPRKAFMELEGSAKTEFPLVWCHGLPFEWSEVLLSRSHTEWATTFDSAGNPAVGKQKLPVAKILVTNELLQNILKIET